MRKKKDMKWLRNIMKEELCFKSLAYCCGLEKHCPMRNRAMRRIGLSPEKYRKLKNLFDKILLEVVTFEKGE